MTPAHPARSFARLLRRITMLLLPPALLLIFVAEMLLQFVELQDRNEVISAGIVIALLAMSTLSFGWNRSLSNLGDHAGMGPRIHQAGVNLFTAALLALVALFFVWIKLPSWMAIPSMETFFFVLHWVFLLLAMIYAMQAVWTLVMVAMGGHGEAGGDE